ncbi:hypothetical protein [Legionella bozemanae]|uniref:hypothetical protein n=1 Tax=Legionella bozemanae TaxID=447 RepID=UPI001040F398|nr:hypothetical protein [Legionella bozemanae]
MDKKVIHCPVCGSENVTRHERENSCELTLGKNFSYNEIFYHCDTCSEESDYFSETDKNYLLAEKEAQKELVKNIIDNLQHSGISMALIERVFELPIRTLTRWKNGDISASGIALLRIISTFPWTIEIAEQRFDRDFANLALIKAAIKKFEQQLSDTKHNTFPLEKQSGGSVIFGNYRSASTAPVSIKAIGF